MTKLSEHPTGVAIQGVTAGVRAIAQHHADVPPLCDVPAGVLPVENVGITRTVRQV